MKIITTEDIKEYWLEIVVFTMMICVIYTGIDCIISDRDLFSYLPRPFRD